MVEQTSTDGARVYLDHAASSPMLPAAVAALVRHAGVRGNPAALHGSGRAARAVLEDAREELAAALGAHPTEVLFTGGGTEADAIALHAGSVRPGRRGVFIGATEHPAVAGALGCFDEVTTLPCDLDGVVEVDALAAGLTPQTAMVSLMAVNNETGTIQPLEAVAATTRRLGTWLHTDAVQALGHVGVDFAASPADLMSLSAHKIGGPVGIGALLARRELELAPWGPGGAQERAVRSGTQPVMLAAAFAAAASHAVAQREAQARRLGLLRERLVERIRSTITGSYVNGGDRTSPAIVNITFDQTRADDVLMLLDQAGIDCSTGSACRAGVHQPSEVLLAMGRTVEQATASVRFSFGHSTTSEDLEALAALLPDVVSRARAALAGAQPAPAVAVTP